MAIPVAPTNVRASDGLFTNGILIQWDWAGSQNSQSDTFEIYRWLDGEAPVFYKTVFRNREYLDRASPPSGEILFGAPRPNLVYNYAVKASSFFYGD